MIRIGILTSSRADYGIYLPLLRRFNEDEDIELKIIAFGTHISQFHGYTLNQIKKDGFEIYATIESLLLGDSPNAVSSAYALTSLKFSEFWQNNHNEFDVVFALGDRYEMAAAVAASIPYAIRIAHIHGGETTLGAIDNIYRHSITLSSSLHFVCAAQFADRVCALLDKNQDHVFNVGSLGIENLMNLPLLDLEEFQSKWNIDLKIPSILLTVHPETSDYTQNEFHCKEIEAVIRNLISSHQIIITMPNADTNGMVYRMCFESLGHEFERVKIIENFGSQSYFTCMHFVDLVVGNSSSGIIEAASMKKYVINLGSRQQGRLSGDNVIHLDFDCASILESVQRYAGIEFNGSNPYYQPNSSEKIVEIIKRSYAALS